MASRNYYLLGQAIRRFDPKRRRLTPGCLNNLLTLPSKASVILRHVWPEMMDMPECREALVQIDWDHFPGSTLGECSFWSGYYQDSTPRGRAG